jgi:REP element-mobilizing transposase RayT
MTAKFRNKYRVESSRLTGYDYTRDGAYFITICTKNKIPVFGCIVDGKMILSGSGEIVHKYWLEIPVHFPKIYLDEFVIMPDHIHGIIIINSKTVETPNLGVSIEQRSGITMETPILGVSTPEPLIKSRNPNWKTNSIGSVINQFKRICTIKTKSIGLEINWQPRFHDRIICSENELQRKRKYIIENPQNWS